MNIETHQWKNKLGWSFVVDRKFQVELAEVSPASLDNWGIRFSTDVPWITVPKRHQTSPLVAVEWFLESKDTKYPVIDSSDK